MLHLQIAISLNPKISNAVLLCPSRCYNNVRQTKAGEQATGIAGKVALFVANPVAKGRPHYNIGTIVYQIRQKAAS